MGTRRRWVKMEGVYDQRGLLLITVIGGEIYGAGSGWVHEAGRRKHGVNFFLILAQSFFFGRFSCLPPSCHTPLT